MISLLHRCVFTAVPRTASKSIRQAFGLPLLGKDYHQPLPHILAPFGHTALTSHRDQPFFKTYFKFAFVRNPWDRAVSAYFYLRAGGCNEHDLAFQQRRLSGLNTFTAFVRALPELHTEYPHLRPQSHWLCDETGSLLPDFVGRFESLDLDFEKVRGQLAHPVASRLARVNASCHDHYHDYYTTETEAIIASVYERDVRLFGYSA